MICFELQHCKPERIINQCSTPDAGPTAEMKADVLSVLHTCPLLSFSHQTAGEGNPFALTCSARRD